MDSIEFIYQTDEFEVVRTKDKGKCVMARKDFGEGSILFINNYLAVPKDDLEGKGLNDHYFWSNKGKKDDTAHVVFGIGTFLNHSYLPNTCMVWDTEREVAIFSASREIKKGEEITIDYEEIWFDGLHDPITLTNNEVYDMKEFLCNGEDHGKLNQRNYATPLHEPQISRERTR
jgi:uncharacterized protein